MNCSLLSVHAGRYRWGIGALFALVLLCGSLLLTLSAKEVTALTTVPTKMNFQGRLTDSSGNIKADGLYNMKFSLYTVNSGGSAVWTETRETTNRVQITNGLFSVKLGDVTTLPASLFASGDLYLEIELPTPATATCSTASCASFTEGAMTPRNQMATSAYAYNSETLDGLDSAAFVQLANNNTFTGTNLFKPSTDSATAFQVQNAAGANLLTVDTISSNMSLLGNNTSTLSAWNTTTAMSVGASTPRVRGGAVAANGYLYHLGGIDGAGTTIATVQYAKLNADGTVGTWASTTALPDARRQFEPVVANGYIYVIGGRNNSGTTVSTSYYAKLNTDGTVGTWNTTTDLTSGASARFGHGTVAYNGYMYVVGGWNSSIVAQNTVYYAKLNPDGTLASTWSATTNLAGTNGGRSNINGTIVANGYIYVPGGYSVDAGGASNDLLYAKLNSDGTIGSWTNQSAALQGDGDENFLTYIANGYLYVLGGDNGQRVTALPLNANGSVGSVTTLPNFPLSPIGEASMAQANGYLYVLGGSSAADGGGTARNTVYYASTPRVKVGANLDLVGYSGENLAEGGSGGQLTAGNTTIVGTLQIQGSSAFNGSASITGNLTVRGTIYSGDSSGSNDQNGVIGRSGSGAGLQGISGTGFGMQASSTSNIAVLGTSTSSIGVQGRSDTSTSGLFVSTNTSGGNTSSTLVTRASTNQPGDLFQAQDSGNVSLFEINVDGSVRSKVGTGLDSTTAFVIQDAGGVAMLTVDGVNDRLYIGNVTADTVGVVLVLDTKTGATDPTGVNGAMYYNSGLKKFRCYQNDEWRDCLGDDVTDTYKYQTEFMRGPSTNASTSESTLSNISANGGSVALLGSEPKHPGVVQLRSGTTNATGQAALISGNDNSSSIRHGNSIAWSLRAAVRVPNLSDATNTYSARVGFYDRVTTESTDGCFFRYTHSVNSGRWEGVCRNNDVESTCDTGIFVSASVWKLMEVNIVSDASSAVFSISGVQRCTVSSNIPSTSGRTNGFGAMLLKTVGTTVDSQFDIDFFDVRAYGSGFSSRE